MARKRGNKQKQAKNAKNSAKAEAKAQARALQELEDERYLCELEEHTQNEALVTSTADAVAVAADATGDEASSAAHGCGMAEILSVADKLLESIVQSLTDDVGIEGLEIDYKKLALAKNAYVVNGVVGSNTAASTMSSVTDKTAGNEIQDQETLRAMQTENERLQAMQAENERLRAQLAQREAEVDGLNRLVEAQKTELFVARSQVAQLDAFVVHEIRRIFNYISFPAGVSMLIQGLQHQYALREEHFAAVEQMLVLESQLWQEKCRLAEARELKAQVREAEEREKQIKKLLLESEQKDAKTRKMEAEVKHKLDECTLMFRTLAQCNTDIRETMNQLTKDLFVDVRALSGIKPSIKQVGPNKPLQPMQMFLEQGRLGGELLMVPTSEHCGKHPLGSCKVDHDDAMQDLEPLMPQLVAAFPSCDMTGQHHVMVGESPRVIRMPRRRNSRAKDRAPAPNNVSGSPNKPTSQRLPSKSETKPVALSVPSGDFTFLSP